MQTPLSLIFWIQTQDEDNNLHTHHQANVRYLRSQFLLACDEGKYHNEQTPWSRGLPEPTRSSCNHEIPHILGNPKAHCYIQEHPPSVPVLSQSSSVQPSPPPNPTSWSILILASHLCLCLPSFRTPQYNP